MHTTTEPETLPETPDLSTYYGVHRAIRRGAHLLADTVMTADAKAIDAYWRGFSGEIHAHHTVEDELFFPALVERVPVAAELMARTDADHAYLDELLRFCSSEVAAIQRGAGRHALCRGFAELAQLMDRHLDFEDEDIVPLFQRHFSKAEYDAIEQMAIKSTGVGPQAAFTVPFVVEALDPETRAEVLASAPIALRVLYRLTKGRYQRMEGRLS